MKLLLNVINNISIKKEVEVVTKKMDNKHCHKKLIETQKGFRLLRVNKLYLSFSRSQDK